MARIRKRPNDRWNAEVRYKKLYKSKTFNSKTEAQSWAVEVEREMGKNGYVSTHYTLGDAMDRYAKEVSPKHKGEKWEQIRIKKLKRHPITDIRLEDLTTEDFQQWIDDSLEAVAPATVRRELAIFSSVMEVSRKRWKWHIGYPIKDVDKPKKPSPRDRRISPNEEQIILKELGFKDRGAVTLIREELAVGFLLALETAMRQGELWGLVWERIHLAKNYVTLADTKNGTSRDVALSKRAVELLNRMDPSETGKVFKTPQASVSTMFSRIVKKAGIDDLTFHDTRHEGLTRLARKIDVLDLARMVGHKDPKSLMIYYNATASEIADRLNA